MITGSTAPLGAAHLRAACLCSLGRPEDAWEAFFFFGGVESVTQSALVNEVLGFLVRSFFGEGYSKFTPE